MARQVRRKQRQARAVAIGESREHAAHREESGERTRNRGGNDKRRRVEIEAAAEEDVELRAVDRLTQWMVEELRRCNGRAEIDPRAGTDGRRSLREGFDRDGGVVSEELEAERRIQAAEWRRQRHRSATDRDWVGERMRHRAQTTDGRQQQQAQPHSIPPKRYRRHHRSSG